MSTVSNPQAITARSQEIARVITTPLDVFVPKTKNGFRVIGIWDTGASGTAITSHLVKQLGLVPTGKVSVNTAGGSVIQNTYTFDCK
ncbi:MAG: aspartyl protease family protein [Polaribacter sp.]